MAVLTATKQARPREEKDTCHELLLVYAFNTRSDISPRTKEMRRCYNFPFY